MPSSKMHPFNRTTRCLVLGMSNLLIKVVGAVFLNSVDRPLAGVASASLFSVAAAALIITAAMMTRRGAVNIFTICPLFLIYVVSLSALLWLSNTGLFGFDMVGTIGVVFCVLVYYSSLPIDEYKAITVEDEENFDPRVTQH